MKSAELRTFPCPFQVPESLFGDKKSVTEKVLLPYEKRKFTSLKHARNLSQSEKTTMLPQSLI